MIQKTCCWSSKEFTRQYLRQWRKEHPILVARHNYHDSCRKQTRYATDEEYRNAILEKRKKLWEDPEFRKKRAKYMRTYRKKKKRNLCEKSSTDISIERNFSEKRNEKKSTGSNFAEK